MTPSMLLFKFQKMWELRFDGIFISSRVQNIVYLKRAIEWSSPLEVEKIMEFIFENWEYVKGTLKVKSDTPGLFLFGTASYFNQLKEMIDKPIVSYKDRVTHDDSPEVGW